MSKWTDVRDGVVDALNLDDVTEQVKEDLTASLLSDGLPALEDVASTFVAKIQAQATAEKVGLRSVTRLSCRSSSKERCMESASRSKNRQKRQLKMC